MHGYSVYKWGDKFSHKIYAIIDAVVYKFLLIGKSFEVYMAFSLEMQRCVISC